MSKMIKSLEVHQCLIEDTYHNYVRIPAEYRGAIKVGSLCSIKANGKSLLTEVRELHEVLAMIRIGEEQRRCLGADLLKTYEFEVTEVGWLKQFGWAWNASNPASRIAARLGLLGVVLGAIGLFIALSFLLANTFE